MNAARLLAWETTERRRRRAVRGPLGKVLGETWAAALVVGLAAAGALWWIQLTADDAEARGWWLVAATLACMGVVARGPWRLFWRPDAALLARLPIPGGALYALGTRRSVRAAAAVTLAALLAAAPRALAAGTLAGGWLHDLAILLVAAACAAALAPAATALAGAVVASDKAQKAIASMTGEFSAPTVAWLSLLPGIAAVAVGTVAWLLAPWAGRAGGPDGLVAGGAAVGGSLVAWVFGALLARRTLSAATREVAALDAVKLAHVQLDAARGVEAAWGRLAAGGGAAGAIYRKDVALARRRYPGFYILSGLALVGVLAAALVAEPPKSLRWIFALAAGAIAYAVLFRARLAAPPVEQPRLLSTLPVPPGAPRRAKDAYFVWRMLLLAAAVAVALLVD